MACGKAQKISLKAFLDLEEEDAEAKSSLADKMQLIDVLDKALLEKAVELEKVKEVMVPSLEKTKFARKAIEDMESMSNVDEVMDSEALLIGEIPISLNCSSVSLTLLTIFKSKKTKEDLVKVEGNHPALSVFFVIESTVNNKIFLGRD